MNGLDSTIKSITENKELLRLIYTDLAQPGVRQVGQAIETILGLGNTFLLPIRLANESASAVFRKNMEKFRKSLEGVSIESIQPLSPELGVPVLDHLSYISDDKLSDMFVALLHRAAQKSASDEAHPGFISIIASLCPDEALLLEALSPLAINRYANYAIRLLGGTPARPEYADLAYNRITYRLDPHILNKAALQFPDYAAVYIDNLTRLGLIETGAFMFIDPNGDLCIRIREYHGITAESDRQRFGVLHSEIAWEYGDIRYTQFGHFFRHSTRFDKGKLG